MLDYGRRRRWKGGRRGRGAGLLKEGRGKGCDVLSVWDHMITVVFIRDGLVMIVIISLSLPLFRVSLRQFSNSTSCQERERFG